MLFVLVGISVCKYCHLKSRGVDLGFTIIQFNYDYHYQINSQTPPAHLPLTSVNTTNMTCTPALSVVGEGEGEGEFSGMMILLRRGRSTAKCSSAIHCSYNFFYQLRKSERFILCHHTYSCN